MPAFTAPQRLIDNLHGEKKPLCRRCRRVAPAVA
jgi:hypothetical protein